MAATGVGYSLLRCERQHLVPVRGHASGDWKHDDTAKVRPDADTFNHSRDEGGVGIVSGECHEDGLL